MYEKLIAELREYWNDGTEDLRNQAADAIEGLQAALDAVNDAHNEGFDVGYWAGRRDYEQKWIPITERLPIVGDYILCYCKRGIGIDYGYSNFDEHAKKEGITHWMPLPPPPQEGERE